MTVFRSLRSKARTTVDQIFCKRAPQIQRVGDEDSGWVIDLASPLNVVYCAGVGLGISFELELAKRIDRPMLVFDPSPTGIATMSRLAESEKQNLTFIPSGLAAQSGIVQFSTPRDGREGSYSISQNGSVAVTFHCYDLAKVMGDHNDSHIDLLKMDIEGFEFEIIDQILSRAIPVGQLCVEFHPWLRPGKTLKTIVRLYSAGYRIIHKHRGDYTLLLPETRYRALQGRAARGRA